MSAYPRQLIVDIYVHQAYYATIKLPNIENFTQAYLREQVLLHHPELSDTRFQTQYFRPRSLNRP